MKQYLAIDIGGTAVKLGIVGLTFSNAIHLASWTHKEVRIPFDEDLYISELEKRKEAEKENGKK